VVVATIGVISDTHGLLRPEARRALGAVDFIVHAGDSEDPLVLEHLRTMASVTAVRGNCDLGRWADALPYDCLATIAGHIIYVVHDLGNLTVDPKAAGIAAVIFGHTHMPHNEVRDGVLFFNPGSAGPRRSGKPVTIGKIRFTPEGPAGEIVTLDGC
jgi:uncharacterized protein